MGRSALLALLCAVAACGDDATPPDGGADAGPIDGGPADADFGDAGLPDARVPALEWPSPEAPATSDPWIIEHHDEITVMRPRILALNFVNARSNDEMLELMGRIIDAIREGSDPEIPGEQPHLRVVRDQGGYTPPSSRTPCSRPRPGR